MIGLEASEYIMNEDERMNVKIVRVGGTNGTISAKLQPIQEQQSKMTLILN